MNNAEIKITLSNPDGKGFELDELARIVNTIWAVLPATGRTIEVMGGNTGGPLSEYGGDLIARRANELLDSEVRFQTT